MKMMLKRLSIFAEQCAGAGEADPVPTFTFGGAL